MARYCIAYDSMKQFLQIKGTENLSDMVSKLCFAVDLKILKRILRSRCTWLNACILPCHLQVDLVSKCKEFADVKLRMNEKRVLNTLNKDKNKETIR